MDKIKVLAISYLFPNEVHPTHGIFVFNRLEALSKYVDITVINPIPWSPLHEFLPRYSALKSIPRKTKLGNLVIYHPRFFSIPKFFKGLEATTYKFAVNKVLTQTLKKTSFDIVDLHWTYPDLPAGSYLAKQIKKPFLVTLRGMEAFYQGEGKLRENYIKVNLIKADRIVALSEELKNTSILLGADPSRHCVIRNGVDTQLFSYINQSEARARLFLPQDKKIIVTVGSLIKRKGFDLIIEALPELLKKNPGLQVHIIGTEGPEGDFRQSLYKQIQTLSLEKNVIFQGLVKNDVLPIWYNAADVFCLASRGEGSPNVLTEAISCGCPAVATDVGAVKEIMMSEPNIGECVPSEDHKAIARALARVLSAYYDREKNAEVFSQYNWDWCAQKVLEVYKTALEKPIK